ncbi:MAG TPA: hypothetical protein VHC43_09915 [Mycobacteriales bacterium]|nr:hypothetical protein [Mycobacteriales bacterium]
MYDAEVACFALASLAGLGSLGLTARGLRALARQIASGDGTIIVDGGKADLEPMRQSTRRLFRGQALQFLLLAVSTTSGAAGGLLGLLR